MGLFSFMTGNSKSVSKVLDAGISGLDKLVFTDEERADYNANLQKIYLQYVQISAKESSAQSISRRMICLPVIYSWLILIFAGVGFEVLGLGVFQSIETAVERLQFPALAAIGFYVGRHMIDSYKK